MLNYDKVFEDARDSCPAFWRSTEAGIAAVAAAARRDALEEAANDLADCGFRGLAYRIRALMTGATMEKAKDA